MQVVLTEKPSVARDIARCLGVSGRRDGYLEGNGYRIVWAFGHLVELQEPDQYRKAWKRWSLETLPIVPERFALRARGDEGAQKQLQTVKRLFEGADEIVCATDAGREGELIFRYILSWCGCEHKRFKRLWISSLTDEAIRQGFGALRDGRAFDGLYQAARCRSEADWIVGLNATRYYTLKHGQGTQLWTLGRVQTPVLAMIVQRDREIADFQPKDFWELHTLYRGADFQQTGGRFERRPDAEALKARVEGNPFRISSVKGKQEKVYPPLLYDLTDLQKDLSIRHGYTAEQTLRLAQSLYEKKHVTYPRTDSRCLSSDMKPLVKPLLLSLKARFETQVAGLNPDRLALGERIFNDAGVTDHHAIIPTTTLPRALPSDEETVYRAIALRFIAAFYPPCLKQVTTVLGDAAGVAFKTVGTVIAAPGWQVLYKDAAPADPDQKLLPVFEAGESGPHEPSLKQGKTSPPKPFTEASLLSMMESAGKTCEDEALKEALKEKGLGTPATRAAIIEVLVKRNYIRRQKKQLLSTEAGQRLIALVADAQLKSAAMTGEWESRLKRMEQNQYDPAEFMQGIVRFTRAIVAAPEARGEQRATFGPCPLCGKPVIEGRKGYGCSAWRQGCGFVLWKDIFGMTVTASMAAELLRQGYVRAPSAAENGSKDAPVELVLDARGEVVLRQSRDSS